MRIPSEKGWVLYDGDCAFCVRWLNLWRPVLRRRGFEVDTLQADWTPEALGMTREEALRDIRLLTASGPGTTGATYAGADVYLYVARRIWWAWPFGILFSLPGFNLLIWAGYKWFAANRYCVSGNCARKI
jgi:predicted DCC family thiol-disulfide oxidoreductase YuxK